MRLQFEDEPAVGDFGTAAGRPQTHPLSYSRRKWGHSRGSLECGHDTERGTKVTSVGRESAAEAVERARGLAADGQLRQAGALLRSRLATDRDDLYVRRALSALYRDAGLPDQAGRYELGLAYQPAAEREAYAGLLVSALAKVGTDAAAVEARIRTLSLLPEDTEVPEDFVTHAISVHSRRTSTAPWDDAIGVTFLWLVLGAVITLLIVFFVVIFGGQHARAIAQFGATVCVGFVATGAFSAAGASLAARHIGGFVVSTLVFIAAALLTTLGVVAVFA